MSARIASAALALIACIATSRSAHAQVAPAASPPPPAELPASTPPPATPPPATPPPATPPPATLPPSTLPPSTLPPSTLPPSTLPPSTLPPAPPRAAIEPDMHLRAYAGGGIVLMAGPPLELNGGEPDAEDSNQSFFPLPSLVLGGELPVHALMLVGAEASLFLWSPESEDAVGYGEHLSIDLSLVPKLRIAIGSRKRHELRVAIPFGLTLDWMRETYDQLVEHTIDSPIGFHVGLTAGYAYVPPKRMLGFFVEAGGTYHRIAKTFRYASNGASDDVVYQPIALFVRGGALLKFPVP